MMLDGYMNQRYQLWTTILVEKFNIWKLRGKTSSFSHPGNANLDIFFGDPYIFRMDKNRKLCFTADPEKVVECFFSRQN